MNIKKGIITGAMALLLGASSLTNVYAEPDKQANNMAIMMDTEWNFEIFSQSFKKDISKEELKKAQGLFDKATKLEEDASTYWEQLYALDVFGETKWGTIEHNMACETIIPDMSFEEFAKIFKKDVKAEDLKKAEELFDKANALDKEEKYEEAAKVWDDFYALDLFKDFNVSYYIAVTPTFEEFAKAFKKDVTPEVKKEAKAIYEKILQLEKEEKYDEVKDLWDSLYKLDLFEGTVAFTNKAVVTDLKKDGKEADIQNAEVVFNQPLIVEKAGDYTVSAGKLKAVDNLNVVTIESVLVNEDMEIISLDDLDKLNKVEVDDYHVYMTNATVPYEHPTFDAFAKDFKKDVKPEILKQAKTLYEKAVAAEKEAMETWQQLEEMDLYPKAVEYTEEQTEE
ncbi:hypothetical protein HZI73_23865 [Vallitalea pronyensis]|uniref:Uncharacterized protein n=1 Tax=Vallitalea pronyensis TaxID=1348613 RepID=A0A8J8MPB9_9FIRM|nr:hypothetical protein [Vallitalea pronyensis]QUI25144.1 hypothetical protein HZI73_23865 [Vallitalea pronyensis]